MQTRFGNFIFSLYFNNFRLIFLLSKQPYTNKLWKSKNNQFHEIQQKVKMLKPKKIFKTSDMSCKTTLINVFLKLNKNQKCLTIVLNKNVSFNLVVKQKCIWTFIGNFLSHKLFLNKTLFSKNSLPKLTFKCIKVTNDCYVHRCRFWQLLQRWSWWRSLFWGR